MTPSRRSTFQGESSRERILEAAIASISERGYSATSVDALCRRAGVVKTALYWHFGSKEGLLTEAIDRVAGAWVEEIQKSAYQVGDPLSRLDRALEGMRTLVEERPQLLRMLLTVAFERAEVSPEIRTTFQRIYRRAERALVEGMEDTIGEPVPDVDLVAHTILALLHAASYRLLIDPDGTDLDRLFEDLRRNVILMVGHRIPHFAPAEELP